MTQMDADKGTSADWHLRKSASSADNFGLDAFGVSFVIVSKNLIQSGARQDEGGWRSASGYVEICGIEV